MAIYKVLIQGDRNVGKTCFLSYKEIESLSNDPTRYTIGVDFRTRQISTCNKTRHVKLQVWETVTKESCCIPLTPASFRGVKGYLVLFDVTRFDTLQGAERIWLNKIKQYNTVTNPVIYLVGTKCDLVNMREISHERAQIITDELGLKYFEVNYYQPHTIDNVLQSMAEEIDEIWKQAVTETATESAK